MPATLSQINLFPVKSAQGIVLTSTEVECTGVRFDRQFMISLMDGTMVTARSFPQLVHIKPTLHSESLSLQFQQQTPIEIHYNQIQKVTFSSEVWGDKFEAFRTSEEADRWVSEVVGKPAVLLYIGEESVRFSQKAQQKVSFADAFPLLLISEASLDDLNERSTGQHTMDQFRTNLVVSGTAAFEEDKWKTIQIGEVVFDINCPCSRCVLTTVDPKTAEFHPQKEPLSTLSTYRSNEQGNVFFGQNLIARNEGVIRQGDDIIVIETQKPIQYLIKERPLHNELQKDIVNDIEKTVSISINGHLFTGNDQHTILEQAEEEGISLPYSCRSGFCGACKIMKESGEISDTPMDALLESEIEEGYILACCAKPTTDIELVN
ncbi:YcbX family protein [Aliivibrio kagoshimensis]|uniref:YcbX family protein n=1 Tax=Aliivibrio kagoshimensis TaxID=2910230 RepID=UPI003D13D121